MSPHTAFQQILLTESSRQPKSSTFTKVTAPIDSKVNSLRTFGPPHQPTSIDSSPDTAASARSLLCPKETLALSLSRLGTETQHIIAGTLAELALLPADDYGEPLHSVVIVGKRLHPLELEFAGRWCIGGEKGGWWKVGKEVYGVIREGGNREALP